MPQRNPVWDELPKTRHQTTTDKEANDAYEHIIDKARKIHEEKARVAHLRRSGQRLCRCTGRKRRTFVASPRRWVRVYHPGTLRVRFRAEFPCGWTYDRTYSRDVQGHPATARVLGPPRLGD